MMPNDNEILDNTPIIRGFAPFRGHQEVAPGVFLPGTFRDDGEGNALFTSDPFEPFMPKFCPEDRN